METPFHWCVVLERIQTHTREQVEFAAVQIVEQVAMNFLNLINKQQVDRQATAAIFKELDVS